MAWDLATAWQLLEPPEHREVVPEPLAQALAVLGCFWGWYRWAAAVLLMFYGITQPIEVLAAARDDLVLPED
eukprot:1800922-Lingulodinium_polyedra.AAC.1